MENKKIKVTKKIEGRDVADVVFHANKFKSHVYLKTGTYNFNIKSLMGMFALNLEPNMEILIETEGEDEQEAMHQMIEIFG